MRPPLSAFMNDEEITKKNLSQNLKNLRSKHPNLSQQAIADMLGISKRAFSNYERGIRLPPIYILDKLSRFYHVSIDDLLQTPQYTKERTE